MGKKSSWALLRRAPALSTVGIANRTTDLRPTILTETKRRKGAANLLRLSVVLSMLLLLLAPAAVCADQTTSKPISKKGLEQAVKIGGLTSAELVTIIQKRGVDFQITPDVEIELLRAGVKPEVIDAARANFKGTPASATMQGGLNGNWTGTFRTCAGGQSTMTMRVNEASPEDIEAAISIAMPTGAPATFTVEGVLNTMNSFLVLHFKAWTHQPPGIEVGNIGGYVTYTNQEPNGFSGLIRTPGCAQVSLTKH